MKIRIMQKPDLDNRWVVESHHWIWGWEYVKMFFGDEAREQATDYAKRLAAPEIIYVDEPCNPVACGQQNLVGAITSRDLNKKLWKNSGWH